ncbi:MAG: elongation factor P [Deltaproteobacteria bacterium]|nr:MAG: elongation factor P [Deltaproteobacteria bacterium]
MYKSADLKKGIKLEIDGEPHVVVAFEFSKPGKGQALYRCRLKNMITGSQFDRTYRSGETFKPASLEEREMQYLYNDGQFYTFMDSKTYEQVQMTDEQVGDDKNFLLDNLVVKILLWQERPIGITLPNFVNLRIVKTEPAARGDTATNVTKPVTVETGYTLQGPAFLEEGELIQVDTRTGDYSTRVKE